MCKLDEQWVKVPGYSKYEVSNLGQIVKIGKTKRIPVKVSQTRNYIYVYLADGSGKNKQVNFKMLLDQCFDEHIYSDHSADDLDGEEWRDVVGWEHAYEVSNCGRVRTKHHMRKGKNDTSSEVNVRIRKTYVDADGYLRLSLSYNGVVKIVGVHRLVAEAFLPNPDHLPQVSHLNGNKSDNCVSNLEWCARHIKEEEP